MANLNGRGSGRGSAWMVACMVGMTAVPAALTLHTVRISSVVDVSSRDPSPYGYTVSLLLFVVPIVVIGLWFIPGEQLKISRKAFCPGSQTSMS